MRVKDIILVQKREIEKKLKDHYISRGLKIRNMENDLIKVVIGPRRAGKSFFAMHELGKHNYGYVNLDDEELVKSKDYDEIITSINEVYGDPKIILMDEIQNLDRWELFANRLQRQGYNLVLTGSNSKLLSRELSTHLTGRHSSTTLLPFSFKELLGEKVKGMTENEIRLALAKYSLEGGYPETIVKSVDRKSYLSDLFNSTIYKDIVKRFNVKNPKAIDDLALFLVSNVGKEYTFNSLGKVINSKNIHAIKKYVGYLEETFILFTVTRFSYKLKEQLSSPRKVYCIDNGMIAAKAFKATEDKGRIYENMAAVELMRRGKEIYYWKSVQQQEEVDFAVKEGLNITHLIQVCYDPSDAKTQEREIRALLKAGKELKCKNLIILTENYEIEMKAEWFGMKGTIKYIPLWKWLLRQ